MNVFLRLLPYFACLLALLLGAGMLNYTYGSGEHHFAWAEQNNFPPPSRGIFFLGVAITVTASTVLGYLLRRSKSGTQAG